MKCMKQNSNLSTNFLKHNLTGQINNQVAQRIERLISCTLILSDAVY